MKRFLLFALLFTVLHTSAQNLTGIWRGTFYTSRAELMFGSSNKYEVQIDNAERAMKGVTYSYQNTTFYGKASLIGIWSSSAKTVTFKEDKLLEYRMSDNSDAVYMFTCFLEYRREGDKEILEGTYTSEHYKTGGSGGTGKIYLEKVATSDFKKEDFIVKKEKADSARLQKANPPIAKKTPLTPKQDVVKTKPPVVAAKPPVSTNKPATKSKQDAVKTPTKPEANPKTVLTPKKETTPETVKADPPKKIVAPPVEVPKVLKERQNDLVRTIVTSANEIEINLYDNGEIDGDTISVFLNGKLIAYRKGLSTKAITLKIKLDEDNADQEITMVAENLGSIPPNTALMIVKAGDQRFDLRISSSNQNNAVVRFHYQAAGSAGKK